MIYRNVPKLIMSLLLFFCFVTGATAGDRTPAGRTITWTGNDGLPFHVTFYAGGRAQGRSDNGSSSGGSWSLTDRSQVCIVWQNPAWRMSCRPF